MTQPEWHGWGLVLNRRDLVQLHIGRIPGRTQVAVYVVDHPDGGGAVLTVLAYCRSVDDAQRLMDLIDRLVRAQ